MGTLTTLYDLTRSSLAADQAALNATANNVANQNTTGYVRQVASFNSGDTVSLGQGNGFVSSGPSVTLTSKRDRVLEQRGAAADAGKPRRAARRPAYWAGGRCVQLVGVVDDGRRDADWHGAGLVLQLADGVGERADGRGDEAGCAGGSGCAGELVQLGFNAAAAGGGGRGSVEISSSVSQVNALTATIATLNGQIQQTSPDADAGTLENQRQAAIAQLSQLVGLHQVTTENNGITLTTDGGAVLVSGSRASALTEANVGGAVQVQDATGADVSGTITGGSIGGELNGAECDRAAVSVFARCGGLADCDGGERAERGGTGCDRRRGWSYLFGRNSGGGHDCCRGYERGCDCDRRCGRRKQRQRKCDCARGPGKRKEQFRGDGFRAICVAAVADRH